MNSEQLRTSDWRFLPFFIAKSVSLIRLQPCQQLRRREEVLGDRSVSLRLANPNGRESTAELKPSNHDSTIYSHDVEKRVSLVAMMVEEAS